MADNTSPTIERVKERRERLGEAADDLERAITRSAGDQEAWKDGVQSALEEVHAALDAHIEEVEAPEGLYTEIMTRSPRLSHAITKLREEHGTMRDEVTGFEDALDSRKTTVDDLRSRGLELLMDISRHRHRGADLIWESYNYDIGSGE